MNTLNCDLGCKKNGLCTMKLGFACVNTKRYLLEILLLTSAIYEDRVLQRTKGFEVGMGEVVPVREHDSGTVLL